MNTASRNAAAARALVDALVERGVAHAVVAPGSRSTPLAVALARDDRVALQVVLDERAAAFRALGIGRATRRPAVVLCTSGTAAAHFHAAVAEAFHGRVPMIVCTADRPAELHGVGAPQTIDQQQLYGTAVRWFCDPGAPDDDDPRDWGEVGALAVTRALGVPNGPVHLNLPFREPLLAPGTDPGWQPARRVHDVNAANASAVAVPDDVVRRVHGARRGLVVAGWGSGDALRALVRFADASGWPVLADAISNVRTGSHAIAHYEALLRNAAFAREHRPDLVVRIGGPPTSKTLTEWLDADVPQLLVDPSGEWLDPARVSQTRLAIEPTAFLDGCAALARADREWTDAWKSADALAAEAIDRIAEGEPRVAREVWAALPEGAHLLVASSMPVRDLEWFAAPRGGITAHANRGANGIDGLVSTALGIAVGSRAPTVALLGDLAFLHDASGLLGARKTGARATFVVVDNAGGGIFSFLPQADLTERREFERLWGTPQPVDVVDVARGYGFDADVVDAPDAGLATRRALDCGGVQVVVVRSDRAKNVGDHRDIWDAVSEALAGGKPA